jgi:hypothetical protein
MEHKSATAVPVKRRDLDEYFLRMDWPLKLEIVNEMRANAHLPPFEVRPS